MLNLRLLFCDRKVMSSSHENSLFTKSKGKAAYDKRPSPNPRKAGSLVHRGFPFLEIVIETWCDGVQYSCNL